MDSRSQDNEQNTSRPGSSRRQLSVEARGGVVQLGDTNITVNAPSGVRSFPSVNVSAGAAGSSDGPGVVIQALDANVSIAQHTNLMLNITDTHNNKQDRSIPRDPSVLPAGNSERHVFAGQTANEFGYSTYGPQAMEHPYQSLSTKGETHVEEHPYQSLSTKGETHVEEHPCQSLSTKGETHVEEHPYQSLSTKGETHVEEHPYQSLSTKGETHVEEHRYQSLGKDDGDQPQDTCPSLDTKETSKPTGNGASKPAEPTEMEDKAGDEEKKISFINLHDVSKSDQQSGGESKETDTRESDNTGSGYQQSITPGVVIREGERLHFCMREKNTYVQIGQCCVIVELNVNDDLVKRLRKEGELTAELRSGQTLVTLQWRDQTQEKDYYLSKLKVTVKEKQTEVQEDLDAAVSESLTVEQCQKVRKIVQKVFSEIQARLIEISEGCVMLTFQHLTLDSYNKIHEVSYIKHLEEYFTALLITDRVKENFPDAIVSVRLISDKESASRLTEPLYTTSRLNDQYSSNVINLSSDVSKLQMEVSDTRENLQSKLLSFQQENTLQMTSMRDRVEEVSQDLSQRFKETADALREEIKEILGQQSQELSLLRREYSESSSVVRMEWRESQFELQLASRLADILLPQLQQSLFSASSLPQTSPVQESPLSEDRHERLAHEIQGALSSPSPSTSTGRPTLPSLDVELTSSSQAAPSPEKSLSARKFEYFLKSLLDRRKSSELYDAQSGMDDEEALRMALAASTQKSDKTAKEKSTAQSKDDTLIGWLKQNTTNDVMDRIRNSLAIAKQDNSKHQSPRASKAIDTVLLLDISDSMRESGGIDEMKDLTHVFIDKIKEMVQKDHTVGYNENVGIVTFGSTSQIIQHITCDFSTTHDLIDKLKADGQQTSILEGILVAISAISGKGVHLKFGTYHRVSPRIIIISDGLMTDYTQVKDDLIKDVDPQTVEKLGKFTTKMKECGIEFPIMCVPVGKRCKTMLERIGKIIPYEDADHLNRFFDIQIAVGRILKMMKEKPKDNKSAQLEKALKSLSQYNSAEKEDIRREVVEKLSKLPKLGTRVKCTKPKENSIDTGTIMQHLKKDFIMVIHDDGGRQYYDWSFAQSSLAILPSTSVDKSKQILPVGTLVERGPQWNFGDQDGGPNEIGVVIMKTSKETDNLVRVCWRSPDAKQSINIYRYGAQGQSDVKPLHLPPEEDAQVQWVAQDSEGKWTPLPEDLSVKIEKEAQKVLVNESSEVEIPAEDYSMPSYRYKRVENMKFLEDLKSKKELTIQRRSIVHQEYEGIG